MIANLHESMRLQASDPVVQLDKGGESLYLIGPAVFTRLHTGPHSSEPYKHIYTLFKQDRALRHFSVFIEVCSIKAGSRTVMWVKADWTKIVPGTVIYIQT